jgi:hypothetical protein
VAGEDHPLVGHLRGAADASVFQGFGALVAQSLRYGPKSQPPPARLGGLREGAMLCPAASAPWRCASTSPAITG